MTSSVIGKLTAIMLAIAAFTFTSCKKDKGGHGNPGNPGNQTKKISRIEENGATAASFEYNTNGTLKTLTTTLYSSTPTKFTFSYDAQKRPTEFSSSEGYRSKYVYQNNILTLTENYEGAEKISENSFQYENGKIKSNTLLTGFPQEDGSVEYVPTFRSVYSYYGNGALQKVSTYILDPLGGELELAYEYVYQQYDEKKNPMHVIADFSQVLMYQPIHTNNPLIEKLYDTNGNVEETTQNSYTYDAAGYPVTCRATITPANGSPTVKNVKFFY